MAVAGTIAEPLNPENMDSVPAHEATEVEKYFDENAEYFVPVSPAASPLSGAALADRLKRTGIELGLVRVGFARAEPFTEAGAAFERWLERGHAGSMGYLAELGDRSDPRRLLPNARTIVVAAMPTSGPIHPRPGPTEGVIADYALGLDYHIALRGRLRRLSQAMADLSGKAVWARPCIDTAPLLEREAARRAGIGFVAKSTMLIVPGLGPRVMLGVLVTTLELPSSEPLESRCGRCTACLDACPTRAFVRPFELDARRCVSYLSIEHQGEVPVELRDGMGQHLVGCDVCQTVCPYDRIASAQVMPTDNAPRALLVNPKLERWLEMSATDYRRVTKRSALRRLGRTQLMRNAAIALGNAKQKSSVPALVKALSSPRSAIVRAHAAWALGKIGGAEAQIALERALDLEADVFVASEIRRSIKHLIGSEPQGQNLDPPQSR
jgi:epoxyqueuosine reductase